MDLKKKYGASWGLVTGSSSGIGKAIAVKLAEQNINVVLVALDDDLLKTTTQELKAKYPSLQFRSIGVDLSGASGDYVQVLVGFFVRGCIPHGCVGLICVQLKGWCLV